MSKVPYGILLGLAVGGASASAQATTLTYDVTLDGKHGSAPTGSPASGKARIAIDTDRQTISVDLVVEGISPEALWDRLVAAPIGPIHLHKYATVAGGPSVLVVPVPYGPSYKAQTNGMRITMTDYQYAAGAALVNSTLSFPDFVTALNEGLVVLNIHTDRFNAGEISGRVGGNAYPSQPSGSHVH